MIVISDTAPIIFFGKINKLRLLKDLYSVIYLPTEVWEELIYPISQNLASIPEDIRLELDAKAEG
jgi:predicted nucleic acid-binding protein